MENCNSRHQLYRRIQPAYKIASERPCPDNRCLNKCQHNNSCTNNCQHDNVCSNNCQHDNVCSNNCQHDNSCSNRCQHDNSCPGKCQHNSCPYPGLERMPLAMAYVPWQHWGELFEPCKAVHVGTIFPELDKPFCERSCGR